MAAQARWTGRALLVALSRRTGLASRALVRFDRRMETGRHANWSDLAGALTGEPASPVSVDVFDTVVVRSVVGDENLFWVIGRELVRRGHWDGSVDAFINARVQAARELPTATLDALYRHDALADHCTRATGGEIEARIEEALAQPVPGVVPALDAIRSHGVSVTFLTDMHLPRSSLWPMLTGRGIARPSDRLVISSELNAAKSSADLFRRIEASSTTKRHIGDDLWSDIAMAERSGVRGLPIRSAEATTLERVMAAQRGSVGAVIAGAARQARLVRPPTGDVVDARLHDLGADVAGQCLTAFLLWVREECRGESAVDVVFLARDGDLPLSMARAMPSDHWDGVRLSCLHANRTAWALASAALVGLDEFLTTGLEHESSFLQQHRHTASFASLLSRVGLTMSDVPAATGLTTLDPEWPLPLDRVEAWNDLFQDSRVRETIAANATERHSLVRDYLRQSSLADRRLAVVDIGWSGRLASQLSALLRDAGGHDPMHLHFGGVNVISGLDADIRRFAVDDSIAPPPFASVIECVETFTQSGTGRAERFERGADGRVALVFGPSNDEVHNPARAVLWEGAIETARSLPPRATVSGLGLRPELLAEDVRAVLESFWTAPGTEAARTVRELWYETDDVGAVVSRVADRYGWDELVGHRSAVPRLWREGSLELTPRPLRTCLAAYFALRNLVRR